jgi:hypothetical protein
MDTSFAVTLPEIAPSLRAAVERLRNGGCVNGLLLGWGRQLVINAMPYEDFRAQQLLEAVHDARAHFASNAGERWVETFWFGYENCHALVIYREHCALVILHTRSGDADFLCHAALTFLEDQQLLIDSFLRAPAEAEIQTTTDIPVGF